MKKVIVFGNDHTNSVGVIQSLGKAGYRSIGLVYGFKNDFVKSSKYVERVISAKDAQACIDKLVEANSILKRECQLLLLAIWLLSLSKETRKDLRIVSYLNMQ